MEANKNTYNIETIKRILTNILEDIDKNKQTLEQAIIADKNIGYTENLQQIKETIKNYINYNPILKLNDIKTQRMDGIGNVAVVYDGNVSVTIESIIKILYTHNNIVLFPNLRLAINECLLVIIKEVIKANSYSVNIEICNNIDELYNNQELYDIAIFVGDKYEYKKFKNRFFKDIIYNEYGFVSIYADDVEFKNALIEIDKYVYVNNFFVDYYNDKDILETVKKINEITSNNTVAIFTKDLKKIAEFIYKVKANKIYVNKNPFENYKFELDEEKLLIKKKII